MDPTTLAILPDLQADAFAQMAEDALFLDHYPNSHHLRFRHYTWAQPAFTFGYSQAYRWVRDQLPEPMQLCRRMTGGGLVDHRADWTYALVIPPRHAWYAQTASETYRRIHKTLAQALMQTGQAAVVGPLAGPDSSRRSSGIPTFCFRRAEPCDVIEPGTGSKIAGAALRRNRRGLLLQGSVEQSLAAGVLDWEAFRQRFIVGLEECLAAPAMSVPRPQYPDGQEKAMHQRFASHDWNRRR